MSNGGPLKKRKRVEQGPVPSDTLWFDDGNVVLQAGAIQFKVHRSFLGMYSPVLKTAVSPPPSRSRGLRVEGCPVVRVEGSSKELAIVLQALYHRDSYETKRQPMAIDIITIFLRLGRKLDISVIHTEGIGRLYYEYPCELQDYDMLDRYSQVAGSDELDAHIVTLAREHHLHSVLPVALYGCCRDFDAEDLRESNEGDDGTATLPLGDLVSCLAAYQSLARLQAETTFSWLDHTSTTYISCQPPTRKRCTAARMQVKNDLFYPVAEVQGLITWEDLIKKHPLGEMCSLCAEVASELHEAGRKKFWIALPGTFDLPNWQELKKERT